jgi:hypothetical protein
MWIGSVWRGIYRFFAALNRLNKAHPTLAAFSAFVLLPCVLLGGTLIYLELSEAYDKFKFNHLSPAEHLRLARDACRTALCPTCTVPGGICLDSPRATLHLNRIPHDAVEYGDAHRLMEVIRVQQEAAAEGQRENRARQEAFRARQEAFRARQEAERLRLANQTREESYEQMERNVAGTAHEPYRCATSTAGAQIFSFDNGHYWWVDDGRCAAEEAKEQVAAEQRRMAAEQGRIEVQEAYERDQRQQQEAHQRQQRQRDEDAQASSYWPTTLRVDTDMDSFWLNNEERTCQTFPDDKGKVARVNCSENASHQYHSIPVKFWGGVDRDTVSNWKCRREGDEFVCRAIN